MIHRHPSSVGSRKPNQLLVKLRSVALVQSARFQESASRGLVKVNLQVLIIQESNRSIAVIKSVGKLGVGVGSLDNRVKALNITRTTSNDVHRGLRILHFDGIGGAVVHEREALRVVHVSENTQIDTLLVEDILNRGLA